MKAAFLDSARKFSMREIPIPEPEAHEVRIKLQKVGICGSDMHLFQGHRPMPKPTVIGHEGIGIIDKVGSNVNNRFQGQRVAVEPNINCGQCRFCQQNRPNICVNKRVVGLLENGCFAEYICMPASFAWPIPDEVQDEEAVLIEPLAVAQHALQKAELTEKTSVAIIGLGPIGMLIMHLALKAGHQVFVAELHTRKLQIAVEQGAMASSTQNIKEFWTEKEVSAVFECAGSATSASFAIEQAPRGASVVLTGLSTEKATFTPVMLVREDIQILPSIIYNHPYDFAEVIQLLKEKKINPSFVLTGENSLESLQEAFEACESSDHIKYIIHIKILTL